MHYFLSNYLFSILIRPTCTSPYLLIYYSPPMTSHHQDIYFLRHCAPSYNLFVSTSTMFMYIPTTLWESHTWRTYQTIHDICEAFKSKSGSNYNDKINHNDGINLVTSFKDLLAHKMIVKTYLVRAWNSTGLVRWTSMHKK